MRHASTYRGARRNAYVTPAAKRTRFYGWNAWERANDQANLRGRAAAVAEASNQATKAFVNAAVFGARAAQMAMDVAYRDFYRTRGRGRAVSRILRHLEAATRNVNRRTA